jgi:Glu-tRNA(Gln) amidotransferase subunit E-like FAD-binding protein
MTQDYKSLGFKCGLEIHQQLDGKKLFCDCNALNVDTETDMKAQRRLRAVAGELGSVDDAASHEMKKAKKFFYESSSEDTCSVEYDEEPPHGVSPGAVTTTLQLCKLLHSTIVDEIHFMRKTVVDGSNVTGFQRTALVGRGGYVETTKGKVRVSTVLLEEEAAQKITQTKKYAKYRLDRLGMAMIEIATQADILDPEHAKETAEKIGLLCRSLPGVKRGLGTIRQDVNVSIAGGARTEIKGFQDLRSIPKVIENEIIRQNELLQQGKKIHNEVRKAEDDFTTTFLRPMPGASRLYPETDVVPFVPDQKHIEVPETIEEATVRIQKEYGIQQELASQIVRKNLHDFLKELTTMYPSLSRAFVAESLISLPKEARRKYNKDIEELPQTQWKELFGLFSSGKLTKNVLLDAAVDLASGKLDLTKYATVGDAELEEEIKKIVTENPGIKMGAIMGKVMTKFQGRADGKKVQELARKYST